MIITWKLLGKESEVLAAGTRTIASASRQRAYDDAVHVAEAIERALLDMAPDREPAPLKLFEEARRG